jgi:hypothetical protein
MTFNITITFERKPIRLVIERISQTKTQEKYKVIARNQSFVLQNNRPLIVSKGLKHIPTKWKVVEGGYHQAHILGLITKAIEKKTLPSID